ncbi:uncharacterized protein LOC112098401 isoform X1 [Citrus clementina]|nr:uncharacterized protein LOC112098401 isoform X1 [Citrus x clementina]
MKDPDDVIAYKKSVERLRVHIFLNGLDAEFEQLRGEILRKDPTLDFEETYAYVRRDAMRRTTVNGELDHHESSALIARRNKQGRNNQQLNSSSSKQIIDQHQSSETQNRSYEIGTSKLECMCTHCGGTGHTKSRCYELIGYPEWWDPTKAPKRNSKTKNQAFAAMVKSSNSPEESSSLIATSGNIGHPDSEDNWLWY